MIARASMSPGVCSSNRKLHLKHPRIYRVVPSPAVDRFRVRLICQVIFSVEAKPIPRSMGSRTWYTPFLKTKVPNRWMRHTSNRCLSIGTFRQAKRMWSQRRWSQRRWSQRRIRELKCQARMSNPKRNRVTQKRSELAREEGRSDVSTRLHQWR